MKIQNSINNHLFSIIYVNTGPSNTLIVDINLKKFHFFEKDIDSPDDMLVPASAAIAKFEESPAPPSPRCRSSSRSSSLAPTGICKDISIKYYYMVADILNLKS